MEVFSLSDIFFILVIFQLLFISIFLFIHDKGKRTSNRLLGFFFLTICLNLTDNFLLIKSFYFAYPSFALWSVWMILLLGPLLFLYTKSILQKDFLFSIRNIVHFAPFACLFIITEAIFLYQPRSVKLTMLHNIVLRRLPPYSYWAPGIMFLQYYFYIAASLRLIQQFRKLAKEQFSNQQRTNLSWLTSTIIIFTVCMTISTLNAFIGLTPLGKYFYLIFIILIFMLFLFINRVLLKVLQNPGIFAVLEEDGQGRAGLQHKYAQSLLKPSENKIFLERLELHMNKNKPYLEPDLTLDQLAGQLETRPKILSQAINELLKQNFFDFINRHRIEEAKRLLTNPDDKKITVQEVLFDVGFNSKSSFNTLFKKHTGLTPTEFKRKHMK